MGNKQGKKPKKHSDNFDEEDEFFDDTLPNSKRRRKSTKDMTGLEHNQIISQVKSDPFADYTIIKELGSGSFATVHLVKHNITGAIRAMKAIKKTTDDEDEENNEMEIINEINI